MRRILLTLLTTLVWLLASPSLQLPESGFVEVGATPAAAEEFKGIMADEPGAKPAKPAKKKTVKQKSHRVGSSGIVQSNQPGKYPMQQITPPKDQVVTGTVRRAPDVREFENSPTVPIIPRGATGGAGVETSQDRVIRCTHQGALGGVPTGQQGAYIQNCAF